MSSPRNPRDRVPLSIRASSASWLRKSGSLKEAHPHIAAQWHPVLNRGAGPEKITPKNGQRAWWLGECGHVWRAAVCDRVAGTGCRACSYTRRGKARTRVRTKRQPVPPSIANEWHPTRNAPGLEREVHAGSSLKVWWRCRCGREWSTSVRHRVEGTGCPDCSRARGGKNRQKTAARKNPLPDALAREWHPRKNGNLNPSDVGAGSNRTVWWQCHQGHAWRATVNSRSSGSGCKRCGAGAQTSFIEVLLYCELRSLLLAEWRTRLTCNSGATHEADISLPLHRIAVEVDGGYWHRNSADRDSTKSKDLLRSGWRVVRLRNQSLDPLHDGSVELFGGNRYLEAEDTWRVLTAIFQLTSVAAVREYIIERDHRSHAEAVAIYDMTRRGRVPFGESLAHRSPHLVDEWHPTKNGTLQPEDIKPGSVRTLWWQCVCGLEWQASVSNRSRGSGCPDCSRKIGAERKRACHASRSPMSSELVSQWHPTKNGTRTPLSLSSNSNTRAWWLCQLCGTGWAAVVASRTSGSGCPTCSATRQGVLYRKKRARENPMPEKLVREWHKTKNGSEDAQDFSRSSNSPAWWTCSDCSHEWSAVISTRSGGAGCPECQRTGWARRNPMRKSLAEEWHSEKNAGLRPENHSAQSNRRVWWSCSSCGHSWRTMIANRSNGSGCPKCNRGGRGRKRTRKD